MERSSLFPPIKQTNHTSGSLRSSQSAKRIALRDGRSGIFNKARLARLADPWCLVYIGYTLYVIRDSVLLGHLAKIHNLRIPLTIALITNNL